MPLNLALLYSFLRSSGTWHVVQRGPVCWAYGQVGHNLWPGQDHIGTLCPWKIFKGPRVFTNLQNQVKIFAINKHSPPATLIWLPTSREPSLASRTRFLAVAWDQSPPWSVLLFIVFSFFFLNSEHLNTLSNRKSGSALKLRFPSKGSCQRQSKCDPE